MVSRNMNTEVDHLVEFSKEEVLGMMFGCFAKNPPLRMLNQAYTINSANARMLSGDAARY